MPKQSSAKTITNQYNGSQYITQPNETILQAALRNGHLYPYGCQSGACGACKAKIVSGKVKHLIRDKSVLSDEARAAGFGLLCQAIPQEDLEIYVKEVAKVKEIEIKTLPARVREKTLLADDVIKLVLQLPKTQVLDFLPGQYIDILLKNGKKRSFSIANLPRLTQDDSAENTLELHIRVVPDGHYSPQIKNQLKEKDILRIQGPFGTFFLREEERPIIMVAGGTGFAPIKALIENVLSLSNAKPTYSPRIDLYWGARSQADLYLHSLAKLWAKSHHNIRYIPVLSDQNLENWQGETGFVHEAILRDHIDLSAHSLYAAGPPVMIDALKQTLPNKQMNMDYFYFDSFDYAAQAEAS